MPISVVRRTAPAGVHLGLADPLLERIFTQRNIRNADELDVSFAGLPAPGLLQGIDQAVDLLVTALSEQQRILIVADFDADGATSCALVFRALASMGAADVRFVIPDRFKFGYGLTPEIVAVAALEEPQLLITVDNGISSIAGVNAAKTAGIKVLITDHHLPGAQLPAADAIVNPNQPGCAFPCKNLAGVGVAFYVMLALRARLRDAGWFATRSIPEPNLATLLDLVALGTVADVVTLDRVNRILVEQGLRRIRANQTHAGIRALIDITKRDQQRLVCADIGFAIAPRLNAAGRLEDMSLGIRCLISDDPQHCEKIAKDLDQLNRSRREIELEMRAQAQSELEKLTLHGEELPFGLCLYNPDWHQGVIGILAGRVKEQTHRPVIAFAKDKDGQLKGSARSVAGLHIRDALDAIATRNPGLIDKFGGHAMAAGLSIEATHLEKFQIAFDEESQRHLNADNLRGVVLSDGELDAQTLSLETADRLRDASPWGQGFPEPVFDGTFEPVSRRIVGENHLKLVVKPLGSDHLIDAIAFNRPAEAVDPGAVARLHMVYRLDVNQWRGDRSAQLVVEHLEPV